MWIRQPLHQVSAQTTWCQLLHLNKRRGEVKQSCKKCIAHVQYEVHCTLYQQSLSQVIPKITIREICHGNKRWKKVWQRCHNMPSDQKCSVFLQLGVGCGFALSMPGRALASFLKRALILKPAFALLSMNMMLSLEARSSPSSTDTCLFSERSVLLPTRTTMTSLPRSFLTSSIHFEVFRKEARSIQ